jgi:hypothetical protein
MITVVCGLHRLDRDGMAWGGRRLRRCHAPRRDNVFYQPNTLRRHADRLLSAIPMCVVHDGTPHVGQRRNSGQLHQAFPFELTLKPFRHGFAEPKGINQRLVGHTLACVSCAPRVELIEERHPLLLYSFQ